MLSLSANDGMAGNSADVVSPKTAQHIACKTRTEKNVGHGMTIFCYIPVLIHIPVHTLSGKWTLIYT
ncbi:hypothetical protein DZJ_00420 [Dickeya ananatis]